MNDNKREMHARNIFRTAPDYTALAIKYKTFRELCKLELNGKVSIDYRNEQALRALTQTLLLEYFQLHVDFAPGSLVPTLPLRLNYILWLEDLLASKSDMSVVHGIDIGCGSSCIYSILAAKKNQWRMLCLESNATNVEYATKNVARNELETLITIHAQIDKNVIFKAYFESSACDTTLTYDFCLCNPPFFDASQRDPFNGRTRNPKRRAPPHNARTGGTDELACEGGEVQFVQRIIDESLSYKTRIRIFTTMLGQKQSLPKILDALKTINVHNIATTIFCQGNTTRWGVAWSYSEHEMLTHKS